MDRQARMAGYACTFALLVLAAFAWRLFRGEFREPERILQVRFSEAGTLMEDDPVLRSGVAVGRVRSLRPGDSLALVELELFGTEFVPADTRFVNFNHSLMGARMVVMVMGRSPQPLDEARVQDGLYAPGVAETFDRVEELLHLVGTLRMETLRLFTGPEAPFSPDRVLGRLEAASAFLRRREKEMENAGLAMRKALAWTGTADSLRQSLRITGEALNPAWTRAQGALAGALEVQEEVEKALASLDRFLGAIRDSSGALGALVYRRQAYDEMLRGLALLEEFLKVLRSDGLEDIIRFRRNIRLRRGGNH